MSDAPETRPVRFPTARLRGAPILAVVYVLGYFFVNLPARVGANGGSPLFHAMQAHPWFDLLLTVLYAGPEHCVALLARHLGINGHLVVLLAFGLLWAYAIVWGLRGLRHLLPRD